MDHYNKMTINLTHIGRLFIGPFKFENQNPYTNLNTKIQSYTLISIYNPKILPLTRYTNPYPNL